MPADIKLAARSLASSPGLTAAAVVALALGVGANTAIVSLVDAVLFRPPPVRDPATLVRVRSVDLDGEEASGAPELSYAEYRTLADEPGGFESVAAYTSAPHSLTGGEGPAERVWGSTVTGPFFEVLGLRLPQGPGFSSEEAHPATTRHVVVLGHDLWVRRFGADPDAVGGAVEIDGERYTVVGVAPDGFRGLDLELGGWMDSSRPPALWKPLSRSVPLPYGLDLSDPGMRFLRVVGRAASLEETRAVVEARSASLRETQPDAHGDVRLEAVPFGEGRLSEGNRPVVHRFVVVLLTVAALVLAVACLDVAGLLLVRASARRREIALRMALGSSRARVVRQLMIEAGLLSSLGFLASVPVALWCVDLLTAVRLPFQVPLSLETRVDARMLVFAFGLSLVVTVAFGLATALRASRARARDVIATRAPGSGTPRAARWRSLLIGAQVASALVLLAAATVFVRTLLDARAVEPGFEPSGVIAMSADLQTESFRYDERMGLRFYREALERVGSMPGVESVSWAAHLPLATSRLLIFFSPEEDAPARESDYLLTECDLVGPDYFQTLRIPLVRGRDFTDEDDGEVPVAIVNESMARKYWPGRDPLGARFTVRGRAGVRTVEIVGVARDVRRKTLWDEPEPFFYLPVLQRYFPIANLLVRTEGDAASRIESVRAVLSDLDPALPIYDARPLTEQVDRALSQPRMAATLLGAASLLATVLAALGVYGVTLYSVVQRTHELGVRAAVGARSLDLVRLIVKQGLLAALIGAGAGALGAAVLSRYLASAVAGARPLTVLQVAASAALLLVVVVGACYVPARRAGARDPVSALRWE